MTKASPESCSTKAADAKVELVARAMWEHEFGTEGRWSVNVENPEDWYSQARAVLTALEVADTRQDGEQGSGVPASPSGSRPADRSASAGVSPVSIPNAAERDDPARHLPLDPEEKLAAFIIYIRALEAAGLSPGYGRIERDEAQGVDFSFGLPNFMARNAILTAPETVAEAAEILAQNASAIDGRDRRARCAARKRGGEARRQGTTP